MDDRRAKKRRGVFGNALLGQFIVMIVDLESETIPSPFRGSDCRSAGSHERIKDGIPDKTKHSDESFCELDRIRSRVMLDSLGACAALK